MPRYSPAIVDYQVCSELWRIFNVLFNFTNFLFFSILSSFSRHSSNKSRLLICRLSVATSCCRLYQYLQESQIWKRAKRSFWNSCRIIIYDRPKDQSEWNNLQLEIDSNFSWTVLCKGRGKGAMRLTLSEASTRETRPDHNTESFVQFCDKKKKKLDSWHVHSTSFC